MKVSTQHDNTQLSEIKGLKQIHHCLQFQKVHGISNSIGSSCVNIYCRIVYFNLYFILVKPNRPSTHGYISASLFFMCVCVCLKVLFFYVTMNNIEKYFHNILHYNLDDEISQNTIHKLSLRFEIATYCQLGQSSFLMKSAVVCHCSDGKV